MSLLCIFDGKIVLANNVDPDQMPHYLIIYKYINIDTFVQAQDIDVASIEPIQSFLSLYIYYYIIEKEGCQRQKWVGRHGDAFADIFCGAYWDTHTNIA